MELFERLTAASGVSGAEGEVRDCLMRAVGEGIFTVDTMGNLIVHRKGKGKRVMVCAHMDEVGLVITDVTDGGYLKFSSVGGIDSRILVSKRVWIGKGRVSGIVGMKAVHLQSPDERKTPAKEKRLYIDIGAKDKEEALRVVSLGDVAVFDHDFVSFGEGFVKAKALDDRVGCRVLLSLLKEDFPCDFYGVFTVQEEVGLRGARIAAERIRPDVALVLEGTTCSDTYGTLPHLTVTRPGDGVVLPLRDRTAILDHGLVERLQSIAEEEHIPYQWKRTTAGGTDAGAVHQSGVGVKTAILAVPIRYLHSPTGVMKLRDMDAMERLAKAFLRKMS